MGNGVTVKALLFDVFGTLVDYRSTIIKEGKQWNEKKGLSIDWARIADEWRGQYAPNMKRVREGELEWMNLDALHRMALDEIMEHHEIAHVYSEEEKAWMNRVWHRLEPWGDTVPGLTRLKENFIIAPLSNGNMTLQINLGKWSGLPWDVIFSPEIIKSYKPDPTVYRMAVDFLGLQANEVMMVAAHQYDLEAARELGLKTAYILRPLEFGYEKIPELAPKSTFDFVARDVVDLANQLK